VGATRVFGSGASHGGEDDCICICSVGENGAADGCEGDDVLLGKGTTDGGRFEENDGSQSGIAVAPPLVANQRIFAVDVCVEDGPLAGPVVTVGVAAAPAPALSPLAMFVVTGLLGLVGAVGLRRLRRTG
jgi:hypothetical protein